MSKGGESIGRPLKPREIALVFLSQGGRFSFYDIDLCPVLTDRRLAVLDLRSVRSNLLSLKMYRDTAQVTPATTNVYVTIDLVAFCSNQLDMKSAALRCLKR